MSIEQKILQNLISLSKLKLVKIIHHHLVTEETMKNYTIHKVIGREILDSRGNPTVEAEIQLENGIIAKASVPSGASTGQFEAKELRDNHKKLYNGKGVQKAVEYINGIIHQNIRNINVCQQEKIDNFLCLLDGSKDKSRLGANTLLAVSIACCKAAAKTLNIPLFQYIGGIYATKLPRPMMNILNGGAHSNNNLDIQEFMIVPLQTTSFSQSLRQCTEVYQSLKKILKNHHFSVAVGDEGGFAPHLKSEEEALSLILEAILQAGYEPNKDFALALDGAASEWHHHSENSYKMPKSGKKFSTQELIAYWEFLVDKYPIISLEDPLAETDWQGWQLITKKLGKKIQLVGDDLFVTHTERLEKGIHQECANSILIKPNQIGTVSETLQCIHCAQNAGYSPIISHRSGDTEDSFIADLCVGTNAGQIKAGAPCRGERIAKYNQLLRIEQSLSVQ